MNDLKEYYENHLMQIGMPDFENLSEIALVAIRGSIGYQVFKLGGNIEKFNESILKDLKANNEKL